MPKLKVGHISPSHEEDAAINAGMAADPDSRELDAAWFSQAKPASEALPPDLYAALVAALKDAKDPWSTSREAQPIKQFIPIAVDA